MTGAAKRLSHAREFLAAGFVLLVIVLSLSVWFAARERATSQATQKTLLVTGQLSDMQLAVRSAESGQRGYLLTGDPQYLTPYDAALTVIPLKDKALHDSLDGGPQAADLVEIDSLVKAKLAELAKTVALFLGGDTAAAVTIVKTNVGYDLMLKLQTLVTAMQRDEARVLVADQAMATRGGWLVQGGTAAVVICTILLAWFAIRENRLQNLQIAAADAGLRAANEDLERKVEERTRTLRASQAALAEANTSLEARVAERSRELERIFRLSNDVMAVADFGGRLRNLSPAWTRITGWPAADTWHRSFASYVHPDDRAAIRPALRALRAGTPLVAFECRVAQAAGGWCWLAWRAVPVREDALIYAIGRDVTQEKLREEQLRQSQKMEVVGQLTGGIAHDFNNLLTIIMGSLEMLQRDNAQDPKTSRRVEAAMGGAKRAAALTHRLLAFSRRQPLAPQQLDVNRLLTGMWDMLHRSLGETMTITQINAAGLWPVLADANQLENAILNLVVNARDAMPEGGRITIETANATVEEGYAARHPDLQPGSYVMIAISDTGTGMTDAVKAKIFEPFFTTKPQGQGTGLGLAQVYGFIKQSGGHVVIHSEPGHGTTVKLYLPRTGIPDESVGEVEARQIGLPPRAAGETILLVEDEDGVRAFSTEILENFGYRVLAVADAAAALAVFETTPAIDMLFTDVVLTGPTNGRQLADVILSRRGDLPVLFTTGYTRDAIMHQGRLDEGLNFIGKPFTAAELGRKVGEIFATAGTAAPSRGRRGGLITPPRPDRSR